MAVLVGLIMLAVLHFNIVPSPTPSVLLKPYQKVWFPDFDLLFETPSPSSPMRHLACDPIIRKLQLPSFWKIAPKNQSPLGASNG